MDTKQTIEERLDKIALTKETKTNGVTVQMYDNKILETFINTELTSLIQEILKNNKWYPEGYNVTGLNYISVEDILKICESRGIEV